MPIYSSPESLFMSITYAAGRLYQYWISCLCTERESIGASQGSISTVDCVGFSM